MKHYINGQWSTFPSVDDAVIAARTAFQTYRQTTVPERISLIRSIYTVYKSRKKEIGKLISKEIGSPITIAQSWQVDEGCVDFEKAIELLNRFSFKDGIVRYEPIGVCGIITSWNWPMCCITELALPALAAGCTVIVKPSELVPLSSLLFAECVHDAGVPAGIFNLINCESPDHSLGHKIAQHPDIDIISFRGSNSTAKKVATTAAATLKQIRFNLGGKSPAIIFDDYTDLEHAVEKRVNNCMNNSGQGCGASTRLLVHKNQYDIVVNIAIEAANNIEVNYPDVEGYHMGPVVSEENLHNIKKLMQEGVDAGARIVAGGFESPLPGGNFIRPTIFADVNNSMSIAQEEFFGPVLCIIPYENDNDAIHIANDSIYDLSAYVYTNNSSRAEHVAQQLTATDIHINDNHYPKPCKINDYLKTKKVVHSRTTFIKPQRKC